MLDQLRDTLATAQADIDAAGMGKPRPKRVKPWCNYRFDRNPWGFIEVTVERIRRTCTYHMTQRQYDRFVRLANSGDYHVEIMDSDHGIAWQMYRK